MAQHAFRRVLAVLPVASGSRRDRARDRSEVGETNADGRAEGASDAGRLRLRISLCAEPRDYRVVVLPWHLPSLNVSFIIFPGIHRSTAWPMRAGPSPHAFLQSRFIRTVQFFRCDVRAAPSRWPQLPELYCPNEISRPKILGCNSIRTQRATRTRNCRDAADSAPGLDYFW